MSKPCQNCGKPNADPRSFDLDLPTVWLCGICSVLIVTDRELFDEIGGRE